MNRTVPAENNYVLIDGKNLELWEEAYPLGGEGNQVEAPIVYLGTASAEEIENSDLQGKIAVIQMRRPASLPESDEPVNPVTYTTAVLQEMAAVIMSKQPAGFIAVADSIADNFPFYMMRGLRKGWFVIDDGL